MSTCSCYSAEDDETQSFWKRLASKYEKKIRKLTQKKREISQRLEVMQLQMPACLYRNMMRAPGEAEKRLENFMRSLLRPEELPDSSRKKCTCDPCPMMIPDNFPENLYDYQYAPTKTYVPRFTKSKPPIKISDRTLNKNLICSCKYCAKKVLKRLREEKEKEAENNFEFMIPEKLTCEDDIRESENAKNGTGACNCCTDIVDLVCECNICAEEVIKRINSPDVVFEPLSCGCDGSKKPEMEDVDIPICQCDSCKVELNRRLAKERKETDRNECFCNKNLEIDPNRLCDCNICAENLRIDTGCPCNAGNDVDKQFFCNCDTCTKESDQNKDQTPKADIDCLCNCNICFQIRSELSEAKVPSFEATCMCDCDICNEARKDKVEDDVCSCESDREKSTPPSLSESCQCPDQEGSTTASPSESCECSSKGSGESKILSNENGSKGSNQSCICSPSAKISNYPSKSDTSSSCVCSPSTSHCQEVSDKSDNSSCVCSPPSIRSQEASNKSGNSSICGCSPSPRSSKEPSTKSGNSSICTYSPSPRSSKEPSIKSDGSSCKCSSTASSMQEGGELTVQSEACATMENLNVKNIEGDGTESGSGSSCLCSEYSSSEGTSSCNCSGTSTDGSSAVSKSSQGTGSEFSEKRTDRKASALSGGSSTEKTGLGQDKKHSLGGSSTNRKGSALSEGSSSARPNTARKCSAYSGRLSSASVGRRRSIGSRSNDLENTNLHETIAGNPEECAGTQVVSDIIKSVLKSPNHSSAENTIKIIPHQIIVNDASPSDSRNEPEYEDEEEEQGEDGPVFKYAKQIDVGMFGTSSETFSEVPEKTSDNMMGIAVHGRIFRERWSRKTSTICSCMKEIEYEIEELRPKNCATDTESCCCLQMQMDKFDRIGIDEDYYIASNRGSKS